MDDPKDLYVRLKNGDASVKDQIMVRKGDFQEKVGTSPQVWQLPSMTVGTKLPNAWGVYDMLSNGSEFVLDTIGVTKSKPESTKRGQIITYEKEETDPLKIFVNSKANNEKSTCAILRGSVPWHELWDGDWFWKSKMGVHVGFSKATTFRLVIGPDLLKERGIK
jgi:hypothetical protein